MIIRTEKLSKRYKNIWALKDVSLSIGDGITLFVGPNGAGKTTFIHLIVGILKPTYGQITYCGDGDFREYIRFIGNSFMYPDDLTVYSYLKYIASILSLSVTEVDKVIEYLQLQSVTHQLISTLSTGFKMRTIIAQALMGKPKLVIADEPFTGLDPIIKSQLRDIIYNAHIQYGINFFISSHQIAELEPIATNVIFINKGKIVSHSLRDENKKSITLFVEKPKAFLEHIKKYGIQGYIHNNYVIIYTNSLKNLFKAAYSYPDNIYSIQMSAIEEAFRDEIS